MAIQTVKTGAAVNDGTGDDARTAFTKINQNFTDSANAASRQVGTVAGNVMEVGAFGLGVSSIASSSSAYLSGNTFFAYSSLADGDNSNAPVYSMGLNIAWIDGSNAAQIISSTFDRKILGVRWKNANTTSLFYKIYSEQNTTVDSNGLLKAASPIVRLFVDKIEMNDEAKEQSITFEKLGVGDYLIKGSLGFAQEGWYIEMPKDANGNVLVAVVYEQLANNDISVKTYAKKFDEETGDIVANTAKPRDIPTARWIDLRLQALPQSDIKPFNNYETAILDA